MTGSEKLAVDANPLFFLDISLLLFLPLEQENKTVFCWQLHKKQKAEEKLTGNHSLHLSQKEGRSGGSAQQGRTWWFGEQLQGFGRDNRKQELTVSLSSTNTYRLNLQLNFCP